MNNSDNMLTASSGLNIQIRLLFCNTSEWLCFSNLSFDSFDSFAIEFDTNLTLVYKQLFDFIKVALIQ